MTERVALKEWQVEIWLILRNGKPLDYAFARSTAYRDVKRHQASEPQHFWSVTPAKGTLSIKVPA